MIDLNLTDNDIVEMLNTEMEDSGEYIESIGSWTMSTLETYYYDRRDYTEIVDTYFERFYNIAEKLWHL